MEEELISSHQDGMTHFSGYFSSPPFILEDPLIDDFMSYLTMGPPDELSRAWNDGPHLLHGKRDPNKQ